MVCKSCYEVLGSFIERYQSTSDESIRGKITLTEDGARERCWICSTKLESERHRQISLLVRPQSISAYESDLRNTDEILKNLENKEQLLKKRSYYDATFRTYHLASTTVHTLKVDRTNLELEMTKCDAGYAHRCEEAECSASTGSDASLNLAKFLLRTCLSDHELCNAQQRPNWYPTRLLRVETDIVRLVHTAVEKPSQPYTTLSYCWGGAKWETLFDTNMAKFEGGIAISAFPVLFQDVFRTVAELGFLYIWIDSFCIVQNSRSNTLAQDKLHEMSQMALVYTNSTLNIGATHASNPYESLFMPCATNEMLPQFARFLQKSEDDPAVYHIGDQGNFSRFWDLPLFSRAWIFQERLLCPRMLHFERRRISWECHQSIICDDKAPISRLGNSDDHPTHYLHKEDPPFSLQSSYRSDTTGPLGLVPHSWREIVSTYCCLNLSKPKDDKFNALAGLAGRYAELVEDKYLAGFFQKDLPVDLCWYRKGKPQERDSRPPARRAPTWSWASTDYEVDFFQKPEYDEITFVEIDRAEIQLLNPQDNFGAVLAAKLWLMGTPLRVRLASCMDRPSIKKTLAVGIMSLISLEQDPNAPTAVCRVEGYFDEFWDPVWTMDCIILPIYASGYMPHDPFYGKRHRPDNFDSRMDYYFSVGIYRTIFALILRKSSEGFHQRLGVCELKPLSLRDIPEGFKAPTNRIWYTDLIESSPKTSVVLV